MIAAAHRYFAAAENSASDVAPDMATVAAVSADSATAGLEILLVSSCNRLLRVHTSAVDY